MLALVKEASFALCVCSFSTQDWSIYAFLMCDSVDLCFIRMCKVNYALLMCVHARQRLCYPIYTWEHVYTWNINAFSFTVTTR